MNIEIVISIFKKNSKNFEIIIILNYDKIFIVSQNLYLVK